MGKFIAGLVRHNLVLVLLGAFIIVGWSFAIVFPLILAAPGAGIFVASLFILFGLGTHFLSLSTGNHIVSWGASIFVAVLALIAVGLSAPGIRTELAVLGGTSVLIYNETLRLAFAHRRKAVFAQNVYISSAAMLLILVLLSLVGVEVARLGVDLQPTGNSGEPLRSENWWIPISVAVLVAAFLATLAAPALKKKRLDIPRLRPGSRIASIHENSDRNAKPL